MNRQEFISYLESRADKIGIPLHLEGELRGLPQEFHHAVAMAHLMDTLGQPAPSGEELRAWYGRAVLASPEAARWAYQAVGYLRNEDLDRFAPDELLKFGLRFQGWAGLAQGLVNDHGRGPEFVKPSKGGGNHPPLSQA